MSRHSLFPAAGLAGLAGGIFLVDTSRSWADAAAPLGALATLLVLAGAATPRLRAFLVVGATAAGLTLGIVRGPVAQPPAGPGTVASLVGTTEWHVEGTVVEEPRARGRRIQVVVDDLMISESADAGQAAPAGVAGRAVVWLPRAVDLASGDRIAFSAPLDEPQDFDGFAYREYLARRGISATATAYEVKTLERRADGLTSAFSGIRDWLLHGLQAYVPEPAAGLGAGILLGVRSGMDEHTEDAFATSGLTHVVAISGWNIAIVAAAVAAMTTRLRRRAGGRWLAPAVLIGAVVFYVVLTGASPSVVRAALMAGAALLARQAGSRAHAASALVLAAGVMLAVAPPLLWDVGFELSVLATAGLIAVGEPISARLSALPGPIREPVALTLAAQVFTLPVILMNFERLSIVAPLANVLVAPLLPLCMAACAVAAVVGGADAIVHVPLVGDTVVWLSSGAAWLYLTAMIAIATWCASLPLAAVEVTAPAWLAASYYPVTVGALFYVRRRARSRVRREAAIVLEPLQRIPRGAALHEDTLRSVGRALAATVRRLARPLPIIAGTVLAVGACSTPAAPDGRLHVTALDIGQGDAILIEAPGGESILFDGGPDPGVTLNRLGETLLLGVRRIDVVVLTHPHEDHIAGLTEVLERYDVGIVLHPGRSYDGPALPRFLAAAGDADEVIVARAGQRLTVGGSVVLDVLFPADADGEAALPEGDINNASIVAVVRYGATDVLLTGDAEAPVERLLLERGLVPQVEVLKIGHHGSHSSSTPEFVAAADPRIALISAGQENEYGHPAAETLGTLGARPGLTTYRTDLHGSVELISDGISVWFAGSSQAGPTAGAPTSTTADSTAGLATIGAWRSPPSPPLASCCSTSGCRMASSRTARGYAPSRRRQRRSSREAAYRSIRRSSRSPPSSTTSTSSRRARAVDGTEKSAPNTWSASGTRSWVPPSARTPCAASSTRSDSHAAGHRSWYRSPTAMSRRTF